MADLQKIASTFSIDLQPVGSLQERDHGRLIDILKQEVGADAACLLAEPVSNRDGSRTDWYTRGASRVIRLTSLPDEQAVEVRHRLAELESRVEDLSARLAVSPRPDDRHLAAALHNCLTVPDETFIYVSGDDIVLTGWGFTRAQKPGYRGGLSKIAPMKPAFVSEGGVAVYDPSLGSDKTPTPAGDATSRRRSLALLLLWLLLALLIAAILFLLLRACAFGITVPGVNLGFCPAAAPALTRSLAIGDLQRELAFLEEQVLQRRDDCAATVPQLGEAAAPLSSAEIDDRLAEHNAQSGAVQVSLIWTGSADLDLSVRCPGGGIVKYNQKSGCGGTLDVDSNAGNNEEARPVENIFWSSETALPPGDLPIEVTLFDMKRETANSIPYQIIVTRTPPGGPPSRQIIDGIASRAAIRQPNIIGRVNP